MPKKRYYHISGKNAILELLQDGLVFEKIFLANNAFKDPKTKSILKLAHKKNIEVIRVARKVLDRRNRNGGTESIVGLLEAPNQFSLETILDTIFNEGADPFILVVDHVKYAQNLGAIFRTAYGAGVNCVVLPNKQFGYIDDEVVRISMGTCLRIPVVSLGILNALTIIKNYGIPTVAINMEGTPYYSADLKGPIAFVIGAEDVGISPRVLERVDKKVSIPMQRGLGSLNVGVSTAVLLFERQRQVAKK